MHANIQHAVAEGFKNGTEAGALWRVRSCHSRKVLDAKRLS